MNDDLAYFLGLWVAEGSFEESIGRLTITCGDEDVGEFLMNDLPLDVGFKPRSGRSDQWCVNSYELMELMRYLKMPLVKAPEKWIPEWVWGGKREWAQHFLSGLWDGDGYISTTQNKAGFTTASEQLAKDVQLLMTNFGIISRLSAVESQPTERVKVCSLQYRVELLGRNVSMLRDVLHLRIRRKAERLQAISDDLRSRRDGVPVLPLLEGLKRRFKGQKLTTLHNALVAARKGSDTTYESIHLILEEARDASDSPEYQALQKFVEDHYYWDEVDTVEDSESETFDFTIPDTHSFWSNGFISHNTPKAFNYLYELFKIGQRQDMQESGQWKSWQFKTSTSPFIPVEEIEAARADMDPKSFLQEYEASFEVMSGRVYYPFDRNIHVGDYPFNPSLPIWVGQDFNIDPMSSVIMQPQPNGEVWIVDEIVLPSSNTAEVCDALERKFWRWQHNITIYPDPAGGQRQHARGETDLDIFRDRGFKKIKHKRKHPPIADRVNAVNSMLMTTSGKVRMRVNSACRETIAAFEQTLYKPGSRDVDKAAGVEHAADALGYCIEIEHPVKKRRVMGMSY